jgi:hypothetical protein
MWVWLVMGLLPDPAGAGAAVAVAGAAPDDGAVGVDDLDPPVHGQASKLAGDVVLYLCDGGKRGADTRRHLLDVVHRRITDQVLRPAYGHGDDSQHHTSRHCDTAAPSDVDDLHCRRRWTTAPLNRPRVMPSRLLVL